MFATCKGNKGQSTNYIFTVRFRTNEHFNFNLRMPKNRLLSRAQNVTKTIFSDLFVLRYETMKE